MHTDRRREASEREAKAAALLLLTGLLASLALVTYLGGDTPPNQPPTTHPDSPLVWLFGLGAVWSFVKLVRHIIAPHSGA